jgi:hypothetical protein
MWVHIVVFVPTVFLLGLVSIDGLQKHKGETQLTEKWYVINNAHDPQAHAALIKSPR